MSGTGFGDSLSVEELIAQKEPLLQIMVSERASPSTRDDALQEARIAVWEVATARPDAPPAYVHAAARMRITEYLTRGKATGAPSMRGRQRVDVAASLDDPDVHTLLEAVEVLDVVVNAYVEGVVAQALDTLTPQQLRYVRLRFWEGADAARLKEEFGYDPNGLWKGAKPKLQRALAHLVPG